MQKVLPSRGNGVHVSRIVTARDVALAPLQAEGAVEQIVRRLGEAIGAGVLAPGERLPSELELAAQLGVAPMTLRQALQILRDAGFVETRRGRNGGSFVRDDPPAALVLAGEPPTRSELRELTDWRRAVSGQAAALAAQRATHRERRAIAAAAASAEGAVGEFAAFRLADARFHIAIVEGARSRRLVAAETQIQLEIAEMLRIVPGPRLARAASQAGHDPIVEAILAGDADAAHRAMERHVEGTYDWIVGLRLGLRA
jgi:DNA-binding FadR family transcriptional regulator